MLRHLSTDLLRGSIIHKFVDGIALFSSLRGWSFTPRDFLAHESHGETGTLNTRLVKYIAMKKSKHDTIIPQTIKYADFYPVQDMRNFRSSLEKTPIDQIPRLIVFTYTYKTNGDPQKLAQVLNNIDEKCAMNIHKFDHKTILSSLYSFMFAIPNKITKLKFYEEAIKKLVSDFDSTLPKEDFVETCFYVGLSKKNKQSNELMQTLVSTYLGQYLNELTSLDFAIVSNACYKTSVVLNDKEFRNRLVRETGLCSCKDDALLVTFIKSLRLNRIRDESVYEKLKSNLLSGEMDKFHFKGLTHCYAYFADGLWNDPEVCEALTKKCLHRIHSVNMDEYLFNDMRAKDLATFLWCCAHTYHLNESNLKLLEQLVLKKIERDEYKNCPDELIDTGLSLWILGQKSRDIIAEILNVKDNSNVSRNTERIKLDSRFKMLLSCVKIDKPEWFKKNNNETKAFIEDRRAPDYLIKNREAFQFVERFLEDNKQELGIVSQLAVSPINELNIPGLLLNINGEKLFLEIIENNQVLKFGSRLIALLELKINLLKTLGYKVVQVDYKELEEKNLLSIFKEKFSLLEENTTVNAAIIH